MHGFEDGCACLAVVGQDEATSASFDLALTSLALRDVDTWNRSAILTAVVSITATIERDTSTAAFDIVCNVDAVKSTLAGIMGAVLVSAGARVRISAFAPHAPCRTIDSRTGGASLRARVGSWVGGREGGGTTIAGLC